MTEYLTEQEQIQQLKNWLKQYGPTIVAGVIVAIIFTSGWHYWQNYRNKILSHASNVYDEMLTLRAQSNDAGMLIQANKLITHYPRTPYAQMAAFMMSRDAVLKKNYPEAITQLNWVIDHSDESAIRQIARLREARIFIAQKKMDEALHFLQTTDDKAFLGLVDEVRGDAYLAKNDLPLARKAYQLALQELPNAEVMRPLLQMKFDNLASNESNLSTSG